MKNISFRKCTPDDCEIVVPLIYSSGSDAFEYVFKTKKFNAIDYLKFVFPKRGSEFSFENHYVIQKDGKIVGAGAIFTSISTLKFTFFEFIYICLFYQLNAVGILLNGLRAETIIQPPEKDEVCIAHLGIIEAHRGKGFGSLLVEYFIDLYAKEVKNEVILDVSEENPRALQLYKRLGFQISAQRRSNLKNKFSYIPSHFRMKYSKTYL